jgi:hypothetical protein
MSGQVVSDAMLAAAAAAGCASAVNAVSTSTPSARSSPSHAPEEAMCVMSTTFRVRGDSRMRAWPGTDRLLERVAIADM